MLEPEYLQRVAEGSEQIASSLHDYIINQIIDRIMLRIGRGEKRLLTSSDKWRIKTLQEAGYLLEDIIAEIEKYTKLQRKEIKASMEEAGIKALKADGAVYEAAGLSTVPLNQSPLLVRLMERNMLATMNEWKNYTRTTAKAAQALYINECDIAYNKVMSGAASYPQAVREAVERIVTDGVYVEYPSGHRDTIETATARAVRTGIAQATGEISLKRMEEMDWDIILVSAHVGARTGDGGQNPGNHYWWQGQYYSRTGRDKRFPNFYESTGYGTGEGLCGWNCRHSFGSGTGDPKDNKYSEILRQDNRRVEELEKKQREMEGRIRKTKRVVSGLQEAVEQCQDENARFELQQELDQKSALLKRQGDAYSNYCAENGLKTQNERLQIARANREAKDSLDEENQEKYQGKKKEWKSIELSIESDKILSTEEVVEKAKQLGEDVVAGKERLNFDNGNVIFDYVTRKLGYDSKPTIVSNEVFEKMVIDSPTPIMYRGINADTREEAIKYAEEFKSGKMYAGKSYAYGSGTYFSPSESIANRYNPYNVKITAVLSGDSKIADYAEIVRAYSETGADVARVKKGDNTEAWEDVLFSVGEFASIKGYDAISMNGAMGQEHIIVLNRGKVVIKDEP